MRYLLALFVLAHGVAHLPGFVVTWRLRELPELPYRTTIFGGALDVGAAGTRALGVFWLAAAAAFVTAAVGFLIGAAWVEPVTWAAVAFSTLLAVAAWPEARFGLAANGMLAVLLTLGAWLGWLRA